MSTTTGTSAHVVTHVYGGGWITTPPDPPIRHRHRYRRAHINKHNRHKKRPNGCPKHR